VDTELVGENLTTKIVLNDYVKESDTVLTKYFSGLNIHELWTEVSASDTTYWRGYLNTTWLGTLDTNMLEKGTYYLGYHTGGSYKTTVCSSVDSTKSTSTCISEGNVVDDTWTGYVGLQRYGEMFSSQIKDYTHENATTTWIITPYDSSYGWVIGKDGGLLIGRLPSVDNGAARPSINLTSTVVIKSGTGTEWDPFVVGLPS